MTIDYCADAGRASAQCKNRVFGLMIASIFFLALLLGSGQTAAAGASAGITTGTGQGGSEATLGGDFTGLPAGTSSLITIDVRAADLRDVLSALAIENGVSILLVEEPADEITFQMENVSPVRALELLLQSQKLAYLREGDVLIVGKPDTLKQDFFRQMLLTRFDLLFLPANRLEPLIKKLDIPLQGITLGTNPYTIWVQGTPQALHKLRELILAVDRPGDTVSLAYKTITATQVSPDRLVLLLGAAGLPIERFIISNNQLLIFDRALHARWSQVESLVQKLDVTGTRKQSAFVFRLKNISAADAAARLGSFGFSGLKTEVFNFAEFGQELLVICPPYLQYEVRSALVSLDGTREKIRVPVAATMGNLAYTRLHATRQLLSEMSGVSLGRLHISRNLSGDSADPHYVLWVEESPEKIKKIVALLDLGILLAGEEEDE